MAKILTIYKHNPAGNTGNPTAGGIDGIAVSKDGTGTSRIIMDGMYPGAATAEKWLRLAIRTDSGTARDTYVSLQGPAAAIAKWDIIAGPSLYDAANNITLAQVQSSINGYYSSNVFRTKTLRMMNVSNTNKIFYVVTSVAPADNNSPDTSIKIIAYHNDYE